MNICHFSRSKNVLQQLLQLFAVTASQIVEVRTGEDSLHLEVQLSELRQRQFGCM